MFTSHVDMFKVEATSAILARLGDDVYQTLKRDLQNQFKIELSKHTSYSLDELNKALQGLLGENSARLIIRTIYGEIARLAQDELR